MHFKIYVIFIKAYRAQYLEVYLCVIFSVFDCDECLLYNQDYTATLFAKKRPNNLCICYKVIENDSI